MSAGGSPARTAVVGVDASLSARLALDQAADRVGPHGRLIVAHAVALPVADPFAVPLTAPPLTDLAEERRAIADELVTRLAGDVACEAETRVLEGDPATALAELAREEDAAEIVVGSRGLGRFVAALGSVSHALLHEADRPVVVVPRAAVDLERRERRGERVVVVGYDGSPAARAALAYGLERAGADGRVVAVHAYAPAPDWLGLPDYNRVLIAHQDHGRELLERLSEEHAGDERMETSLLEGSPARALIAAAEARDADGIVLGSRGFSPLRGALGSVSHALLHEADRPVAVIPARAVASHAGPVAQAASGGGVR